MYLSDLRAALRRCWYVVLVGIIGTIGLGMFAARAIPATYESSADVVLLPPIDADTVNPYLALGGLNAVTGVVARAMYDSATAQSLIEAGVGRDYSVAPDPRVSGPVLLVTAGGTDPQSALRSLSLIVDRLPQVLSQMQTAVGAPKSAQITAEVLTQDIKAKVVRKSQIRGLLVAIAAGLGLTLMTTALIDGLLRRIRAGRKGDRHRPFDGSERARRSASVNHVGAALGPPAEPPAYTPDDAGSHGASR